jgi:thioesterase domain-containing protein
MTNATDSAATELQPPPREAASIWRLTLKRANPLVVLNHGPRDPHVYCIHGVTGDVIGLKGFASHFGDLRLQAIQVPKEQMNGAFATSIESIAARYVELITKAQPNGPIHLVGWSAGAIIALEMAHQFQGLGRSVPLIAALDGAPCNTGAGLKPWRPRYLLALAINLPRWIKDDMDQDWSLRGIVKRIEGKLAYRFGLGASSRGPSLPSQGTLDGETIRRLYERGGWRGEQKAFIHSMYKAMIDYVPKPYDGHVVAYETRTQPLIRLRQIGASWQAIAPRTEIVPVKGNHTKMIEDPAIGIIVRHFLSRLG